MGKITVVRAGPLTSVQDLGRPGYRALGVSRGGALDLRAAQVANLLVGNPAEAGLLEITLGAVQLRFADARAVAWCGGEFAVQVAETAIPAGRPAFVNRGELLKIAASRCGCRAWLAIGGGVEVPMVLDSRSTDLRSAFGGYKGRALQDGDEVSLGQAGRLSTEGGRIAPWGAPQEWVLTAMHLPILRVVRGADWQRFEQGARKAFLETEFTVSAQADRMGVRLEGAELARINKREMLSEAVAPGTVQVANDGQPILLLGDCQTIGGYPKIAHVITVDLGAAAQLQPNDVVRFEEVTPSEAEALFLEREIDLQLFQAGLALRNP
ncbi:MAG TPA: biotin-dependent carboxyltransferase family protein [Chthoniobacteraceae bacterium]|nr:biotin-dependent carboxyltransferase family protein [Chthoniobacteraceae bacterium]